MEVNKVSKSYFVEKKKELNNQPQKPSETIPQEITAQSPANPSFYGAYNNVSFKGKVVDNTNFRAELENRAQISTTSLNLYTDFKTQHDPHRMRKHIWVQNSAEQELKLYKTKHSEYVLNPETNKIYKIRYVSDSDRIAQQIMASKLYNLAGVRTPEYIPFEKDGKTGYLVEILEERLEPQETNPEALKYSFIVDAWLGNRNGLSKDNTKIDKDGNPVKMSVSGSLGYRASGKPKDEKFNYEVQELKSMRDYSKNPDAASALSTMSDDELYELIEKFKETYESKKITDICRDYWDDNTTAHDLSNVLSNRYYEITRFKQADIQEKTLQKRGLLEKGTPSLPNLNGFDPTFSIDVSSAMEITDEQWQTLKDRGLFQKHYWLKGLGMLCYKYLAQMSDEEHKKALERNLYAPIDGEERSYRVIGGLDIRDLSKLSDSQWDRVKSRDLMNAGIKHKVKETFVSDFIQAAVELEDDEWSSVVYTGYYDKHISTKDLKAFAEARRDMNEKSELVPSFDRRMYLLCGLESKETKYLNQNWTPEYLIQFAKVSNEIWKRLDELTDGFTNDGLQPHTLNSLCSFEENDFETLKKRGFTENGTNFYGLKNIANLSDDEWENVEKRGLKELFPNDYESWAYLAELSDEEFQLAKDKNLFAPRGEKGKKGYGNFNGEDIASLVTTLTEKDWENFEKRGLWDEYTVFDGWGYSYPNAYLAIILSKYSDTEFEKYNKIAQKSGTRYIYPSTITELVKLPDEQFQRIFKRNLFRYMNTHEAWDNYPADAPVMTAISELNDKDYQKFLEQNNNCKWIATKVLLIQADNLGLSQKHSITELSLKEKREYLQLLISKGDIILDKDFQENYPQTEIIPQNMDEYTEIMKKLITSVGIYAKPLDETTKTNFYNAVNKISEPNSEFAKLDMTPTDFKIDLKYPRATFMKDISNIVKDLDEQEKRKVWDYFGFEVGSTSKIDLTMSGYPSLINNEKKLEEIDNPQTKSVIEKIKPLVKRFTEENSIQAGKYITPSMADTLNTIFKTMPELYTMVGKQQHGTHDYTIDVHSLSVLQECIKHPAFSMLSKKEKQMMVFASLLHDITKEEKNIDKSHPINSSIDAYFLLEKFDMPRSQLLEIYQLIKNHDMLEQCNKKVFDYELNDYKPISIEEKNRKIQRYAYELRAGNLAKMETIFTKSDLLSVKRDGSFLKKYQDSFNDVSKKLAQEVKKVKENEIALPQTKIPKASKLVVDGKTVVEKTTYDKEGNPITNRVVNMSQGLNLEQYGFAKGVTSDNFNVIVHGFDSEIDNVRLEVLELANQEALLSTSYVIYEKGNYHAFRPYGVIKDVPYDNIGAAYYRDFGSGCKKSINELVNSYINGGNHHYRNYFPKLIKQKLNLTDEQYIILYEEIKDKSLEEIEKEKPYVAYAMHDIFNEMEISKRKFNRNYNEVLIGNAKTTGVFYQGVVNGKPVSLEDLPDFLRKYAQDNDIPIIYFGE